MSIEKLLRCNSGLRRSYDEIASILRGEMEPRDVDVEAALVGLATIGEMLEEVCQNTPAVSTEKPTIFKEVLHLLEEQFPSYGRKSLSIVAKSYTEADFDTVQFLLQKESPSTGASLNYIFIGGTVTRTADGLKLVVN